MISAQSVLNTVANVVHQAPAVHAEVAVHGPASGQAKCDTGGSDCNDHREGPKHDGDHGGKQASCDTVKDCNDHGKDGPKHDDNPWGKDHSDHGKQASCDTSKDCNDHGPKHDGNPWGKDGSDHAKQASCDDKACNDHSNGPKHDHDQDHGKQASCDTNKECNDNGRDNDHKQASCDTAKDCNDHGKDGDCAQHNACQPCVDPCQVITTASHGYDADQSDLHGALAAMSNPAALVDFAIDHLGSADVPLEVAHYDGLDAISHHDGLIA